MFLLSSRQVEAYFRDAAERKDVATAYAVKGGAYHYHWVEARRGGGSHSANMKIM